MATSAGRSAIIVNPGRGRHYDCGTMQAVFKADGSETEDRYSVSEWWLDPRSRGPGPHHHEVNDEIFYVIEGRASLLVGEEWHDLERGGTVVIPAGVTHDFANRSDNLTGLLNVFIPGGFEAAMPKIVQWFADNRK